MGHSLGGTFLLRLLERGVKIKAAFLVAASAGIMPLKNWKTDLPFTKKPFNWAEIRKNCPKFVVFHSDNDPYVGITNSELLVKELGAEFVFVKGAGHFNKAAGYTEFELLLGKIKELI